MMDHQRAPGPRMSTIIGIGVPQVKGKMVTATGVHLPWRHDIKFLQGA
jgi:hypothetical protein